MNGDHVTESEELGITLVDEDITEAGNDIGVVRDLVLRAYDDVVPELVAGNSIAALLASVEPARAAYVQVAAQVKSQLPDVPPAVPAGGSVRIVDPGLLPAVEKIRRGIGGSV